MIRLLLGDYSIYGIYANIAEKVALQKTETHATFRVFPVDAAAVGASAEPLISEQIGYAGSGSHAYACFDEDRIVGVCFYWHGERYLKRNFWPLQKGEAKLVQIIVLPEMRGRGVAALLISHSSHYMEANGFPKTFARIWHSNTPSIKAFERAGWMRVALVVEINPFRQSRPYRIRLNVKDRDVRI